MRLANKNSPDNPWDKRNWLGDCQTFVAEGARVAVTGRDESKFAAVQTELGEKAVVLKGDVDLWTTYARSLLKYKKASAALMSYAQMPATLSRRR